MADLVTIGAMYGLLAAAIVVAAGCGFPSPTVKPDPDAAVRQTDAALSLPRGCASAYQYPFGGHRYRMTSAVTWAAAKLNCESDGGFLMKIELKPEDDEASSVIGQQTEVWIGLRDTDADGTYHWIDDTRPDYAPWATTPTTESPDCVFKNTLVADGRWYTRDCNTNLPAVCECIP